MKKKRFSTEKIAAVLHQVEHGIPVADVCRQVGISGKDVAAPGRAGDPAAGGDCARGGVPVCRWTTKTIARR